MNVEPKIIEDDWVLTCKIFKYICPFASQPQENFVKFLLLLGQRFISYLKSDFYGVKLSWLGNEHISLCGHKETKHEQDKKRKPEKELLEHNSMLCKTKKLSAEWTVPWCRDALEAEKNSEENQNTALLCFFLFWTMF